MRRYVMTWPAVMLRMRPRRASARPRSPSAAPVSIAEAELPAVPPRALAAGKALRNDLGDSLRGVETGGEPVLGERERDARRLVRVGVAAADAANAEHALRLRRVQQELPD